MRTFLLSLPIIFLVACRSSDRATRICETDNQTCTARCMPASGSEVNPNFPMQSGAYQQAGACHQNCERTYQNCLEHQKDKNIKVISGE